MAAQGGQPGQPGNPMANNPQMQRMMQQAQSNPNFMQQAMNMLEAPVAVLVALGISWNDEQPCYDATSTTDDETESSNDATGSTNDENPGMMQKMMQQFGGMGGM